ncbi:LRR receptor-like serine/threonine-protein kinase GHR1 [Cajanus cajan]|uniref:LRR receptor-like serine/threonine-protein kinase GHR1 n=1 Tax=Cajanus cajan TaxID=3821 RepID=UPI00098DAEE0|nr:LRR receptor-like serine/threonine-protein kinase GHR1 [Cajanus cajan]
MKLFSLLVVLLSFFSVMGQLPSQDTLALLEFKKGIKHDPTGYVLSSWNEESVDFDGCPSTWNGVLCNGGNVAGVVLDNLGLSADANLGVFLSLTKLVKLSISNNSISGKLPDNIAEFKSLEFLDVSNNFFFSSLPMAIGKLTSLQNLSLAGNNFSGPIPDSISGMASIQSLDLSRNSFSGQLPASLTKLTNLVLLNLSHNGFTGKIPKGFELIFSLEKLDLHGNMFDGPLDDEFILFSSASYVDFSENMLVSSSSQQHTFLPQISESIKYLNLSYNRLTGSLVSGGDQPGFEYLKVLDLSYNQLSGELSEFDFVYELMVLKLSNNRFSGFVPSGPLKGDSLVLTELDLSGNNLSGPISIITSTTLHTLNLSSNEFTGELPLLTGSCAVLDLSNNKLEGNLTRVMKWGNIEFLDLSRNHLTGSIPEVTPQFLRLNYLNLSHNFLSRSLPRVLTQYPQLKMLDVSSNQLDGKFLDDLLIMLTLQELHLENNMISGNINLSSFSPRPSDIQILDLSNNQFNGYFPAEFGSLTGLKVLNVAGNNFSGSLPTTIANMSSLDSLDISENHFTGPLPINMPKELKKFNASKNYLSGVVPENLRKFPSSSFYPGNDRLHFPNGPFRSTNKPDENSNRKPVGKVIIIVSCVVAVLFMLVLLAVFFIYYIRISRSPSEYATAKDMSEHAQRQISGPGYAKYCCAQSVEFVFVSLFLCVCFRYGCLKKASFPNRYLGGALVVSAEDPVTSQKGSSTEIISLDENRAAVIGFSPSKNSHFSSPGSSDSVSVGNHARLYARSPDKLKGELYFLDDATTLTPEELSRAPAEVLGRSCHGTSYKATLENDYFLRVKWLREGVAKQRKEFSIEAKKFANIRHPNVVGLRGYYWGPTQHEKLILSDYISPGSLASFLYDRPEREGPPLTWALRLKIAVDVARGLNYLHFDRAVPHGNLKATNVLLDTGDLNARVADYCLHKLMTQAGTFEQILDAGILGYRAPELAASKKPMPSFKSDVYAFGVILLELLTGRCAGDVISGEKESVDLTNWVRLCVSEGRGSECFDAALVHEMGNSVVEKGMNEVLEIAIRCIRSVCERPGIKTIYEDLSSI